MKTILILGAILTAFYSSHSYAALSIYCERDSGNFVRTGFSVKEISDEYSVLYGGNLDAGDGVLSMLKRMKIPFPSEITSYSDKAFGVKFPKSGCTLDQTKGSFVCEGGIEAIPTLALGVYGYDTQNAIVRKSFPLKKAQIGLVWGLKAGPFSLSKVAFMFTPQDALYTEGSGTDMLQGCSIKN